MIENSIVADD